MKILFICKLNVSRSQMAETFFNHFSKHNTGYSAGTHVGSKEGRNISVMVTETMNEVGFDISNKVRTQITSKMVEDADLVVTFTDIDSLPDFVKHSDKLEVWDVEKTTNKDYAAHRRVRDQIKGLVEKLVVELEQKTK